MHFQFLGSGRAALAAGWADEKSISLLSSGRIDATAIPGVDAELQVVSIFSSTTVMVPPGSRIQLSGANILGSHSVDVKSDPDGPVIMIQAIPVLGSIKVRAA